MTESDLKRLEEIRESAKLCVAGNSLEFLLRIIDELRAELKEAWRIAEMLRVDCVAQGKHLAERDGRWSVLKQFIASQHHPGFNLTFSKMLELEQLETEGN